MKRNESDDEITYILERMGPVIGEALNRGQGKWRAQLTEEISASVERNVVRSLEDRLTLLLEKFLDDRFDQRKDRVIENLFASMLKPNSQFFTNLKPLVVQILAERFHRNLPMNYRDMIQLIAEEQVRSGMSSLLKPGSTFEKDAVPIVSSVAKECLREELGALLNLAASEAASGPMERISATVDPDTADQMRALGGNFSEHVRNALNVYLKALEGQGR